MAFFHSNSYSKTLLDKDSTGSLDHFVQNHPRSSLILADCIRFWSNRSVLEARVCKNHWYLFVSQAVQESPILVCITISWHLVSLKLKSLSMTHPDHCKCTVSNDWLFIFYKHNIVGANPYKNMQDNVTQLNVETLQFVAFYFQSFALDNGLSIN